MGNINPTANIKKSLSKKKNNSTATEITDTTNQDSKSTQVPAIPDTQQPKPPKPKIEIEKEISGLDISKVSTPNRAELTLKQQLRY